MTYCYDFPRPALTVDAVIFGRDDEDLKVLLIQRKLEPCAGFWAFPGGFVKPGEPLEEAACRELEEEAGLSNICLEQLYAFGDPDRDPREHTVTVAYYGLINIHEHRPQAGSDAESVEWFSIDDVPKLAFDHDRILQIALDRVKGKVQDML